jgi:hypothetical protein
MKIREEAIKLAQYLRGEKEGYGPIRFQKFLYGGMNFESKQSH